MTEAERWSRVKELFREALELPEDERPAFLREGCGGDAEMESEVEELLSNYPTNFMEPVAVDRPAVPDLDPEKIGQVIGPYQILEKIGEGGMGIVYRAQQAEPVRRDVALKIIKLGMDSRQVLARFETERQALALMNHSCIAKVYDAGISADGRPYFAMEHIEGLPLTEYCDEHRLNTRQRLQLFMMICDGVHHAHQKGIIHRDLKPSNILVTQEGEQEVPKIIDFGIAKATEQNLTEKTVYTELGQIIGTPEYMSPEQAEMSGHDIDTRTDIYSLGVILYQLLVGEVPFDPERLRAAGYVEIQRIIREEEPEKPSTRLSTASEDSSLVASKRRTQVRRLVHQLRGDLDWIVLRTLEKERTRRYGSASDLAADVRRHLQNEPVLAGPPSAAYRLRKLLLRHRASVTAATLTFVSLVVGLSWALVERDRADREAAQAVHEMHRADEALGRVLRLSDIKLIEEYRREADDLWPAHPDNIEAMIDWLDKAEELYRRLPEHEASLAEQRKGAIEDSPNFVFADQQTQWRHDVLAELVKELQAFGSDDPRVGTIAHVTGRLDFAENIEERSLFSPEAESAWEESLAQIQESDLYGDEAKAMQPQLGLFPVGADPRSGLQEFLHLETHAGPVPDRDDNGNLAPSEELGLVFVLLPAATFQMGSEPPVLSAFFTDGEEGPFLYSFQAGRGAHRLGLQYLDVILAIQGVGVADVAALKAALAQLKNGENLKLTFRRGDEVHHAETFVDLDLGSPNVDPGSLDFETPIHPVTLSPFFISKYEMTQAQWQRSTGKTPSRYGPSYTHQHHRNTPWNPVELVAWEECRETLRRMNLAIPTEAQWEYAARGGTHTVWWTGNDKASIGRRRAGNLADARSEDTGVPPMWICEDWPDDWIVHAPVGSLAPNDFGLHDVIGNVWEWTRDGYVPYSNPVDPGDGEREAPVEEYRVFRGGGYHAPASLSRSATRYSYEPHTRDVNLGVRPSRSMEE